MCSFLQFHSSSRDNRCQLLSRKSSQCMKTRHLTGKFNHRLHCRFPSFCNCQHLPCPSRHHRAHLLGASPLFCRCSHYLLIFLHDWHGPGSGHTCQACTTHLSAPLISHISHAQHDRAPTAVTALVMPSHLHSFHPHLQWRGSTQRSIHRPTQNCRQSSFHYHLSHANFFPTDRYTDQVK